MRAGRRVVFAAVVGVLAGAWAASAAAARPSRAPEPGCEWKPFHSRSLGVRLLVQDCKEPFAHYVFSTVGNRIEQHRPADDRTFNGPRVLEMYSKRADQSIEQAIEEQFIARLPLAARRSCRVVPLREKRDTRARYTIEPTGAYRRKILEELRRYPRDFGCGDFGRTQDTTYFEYHPAESLTRFAFVDAGMDAPLFDEQSLQFLR